MEPTISSDCVRGRLQLMRCVGEALAGRYFRWDDRFVNNIEEIHTKAYVDNIEQLHA